MKRPPPMYKSWPDYLITSFFDWGRLGQTCHFLWLALRGYKSHPSDGANDPTWQPPTRRQYLKGAWVTVRYGPGY